MHEDGALGKSTEFVRTCHNMKIIVQTKGGDESSINGKSVIPNKKMANITRMLLLK